MCSVFVDSSDPYVDTPDVVDIIPGSASVAGVTVLGSELYIVRDLSPNLDIYDAKTYSPIRRMKLEGLRKPADIAACPQNLSLYVSDSVGHVYCLKPHGEELTRWQVEGEPQGLYAAANGNVFVTCNDSKQVKEYTENGTLVRSVRFQQDVQSTWQTIPVDAGKFVVCHGFESGKLHRVCYVDQSGRTLRAYGGANGSGPNRLDAPLRMSVDPFGYVFVLDRNNDRVQLLSPNLVHVRDLVGRNLNGIKQPRRLFLDVNSGCLSVGLIDGRVLIFRVLNTD